jgi:hypothetical protein
MHRDQTWHAGSPKRWKMLPYNHVQDLNARQGKILPKKLQENQHEPATIANHRKPIRNPRHPRNPSAQAAMRPRQTASRTQVHLCLTTSRNEPNRTTRSRARDATRRIDRARYVARSMDKPLAGTRDRRQPAQGATEPATGLRGRTPDRWSNRCLHRLVGARTNSSGYWKRGVKLDVPVLVWRDGARGRILRK